MDGEAVADGETVSDDLELIGGDVALSLHAVGSSRAAQMSAATRVTRTFGTETIAATADKLQRSTVRRRCAGCSKPGGRPGCALKVHEVRP